MKFLLDLLPVILFFVIFRFTSSHEAQAADFVTNHLGFLVSGGHIEPKIAPIILATLATILISILQIAVLLIRRKKVDPMLWISCGIILIFGGATIYLHDDAFIKWKPTILYWAFSLGMLVSQIGFNKNVIRLGMEKQITLPEPIWKRLGFAWATFFGLAGILNIYVFKNYSTETWVSFKAFGFMGLIVVFVIAQSVYLSRYMKDA